MLEKKYLLTRREYEHLGVRLQFGRTSFQRGMLFAQVLFGLLIGFLVWSLTTPVAAVLVALALALLIPLYYRGALRRAYGKLYAELGIRDDTTVQINETGMRVWRPHLRSEIDWELVSRIEEDAVGFYLFYGPLQCVLVPRRVFADAAEAQEFWTLAQTFREAARPVLSPGSAPRPAKI